MRQSILTLLRRSGVCRVHGLRDVVLLRFFERRSVQEIDREGTGLGQRVVRHSRAPVGGRSEGRLRHLLRVMARR